MTFLFYFVPVAAVIALLFAWLFFRQMMKESEGNVTMQEIARFVREGAMAYLKQQYKVVTIVFIVLAVFLRFWPIFFTSRTLGFRLHSSAVDSSPVLRGLWE